MSRKQKTRLTRVLLGLIFAVAMGGFTLMASAEDEMDGMQEVGSEQADTAEPALEELFNEQSGFSAETTPQPMPEDGGAAELDALARGVTNEEAVKAGTPAVEDPSIPNQITNLEFKHDAKGSRVVVSALRKLRFNETKSAGTRQYIYLFENTQTPEKFQRAYDTTEFSSPVALFTLFQLPNATPPTSKLIVQLREDQVPSITDSDRGLIMEFSPPKSAEPSVVDPAKREILSGDNIYAKGGAYTGEVIQRLEIKNSDVQDVLRLIARTSGYNIVIGDDVTGRIGTLSLTNIPWDQAFTLVLQSRKLGFVREGNVLRVGTSVALRAEKEEADAVVKAGEKVEPLKTVLLPVSYAKATDLAPRAKPFMTERGAVEVDVRTNTIIIKDIEKVVTRVQRLLQALDTQPPRVSISAKIVEMRSSLTRSIGMRQLLGINNLANSDPVRNLGSSALDVPNVAAGSFGSSVQGSFSAVIRSDDFLNMQTEFRLGELENKIRTLANPSVSVVANQTGTVSQSLSFFVPNNTIVNGALQPGFTQVNTTLNLSVTPIVSSDGTIFMTVAVTNDIPSTVSGGNTTIASRAVNTQVLVENGDTAVLGGVFQNTIDNSREGIPLLMRIPILGYLFSGNTTQDSRSEIFIFVTAKIMNAEESFKRTL